MSSVTLTIRLVGVNMCLDVCGVLDYIMHNAYTQAHHNLAYCVHNPHRDHMHLDVHDAHNMCPRRDYNRCRKCSRDRSRRT